jgi:hypothetical protein
MTFLSKTLIQPVQVFLCLIILITMPIIGHAQTVTGSVRGTITDPTGAVIPGAQLTATNVDTGVATSSSTNGDGLYSIRFLPIGRYTLSAKSNAFSDYKSTVFQLDIAQEATIDIKMSVSSATTNVQVEASVAPILNQENPTLGLTLSGTAVSSLPLNGRSLNAATAATPGAVNSGGDPTQQSSFNGSRQEVNSYLLDGMDIYDTIDGTGPKYSPNPDAIGELHIITSNATAEYSNVNGGLIIAVIKSGTNQFHGNAFVQLENYNMSANTWDNKHGTSAAALHPFTQTYFGGTVGGPIIKDKLFFFADYEGFRYHYSGTDYANIAPPAFLRGDFSSLLAANNPFFTAPTATSPGTQIVLHNRQGVPYANNQIPVSNPLSQFLAANPSLYPTPSQAPLDGIAEHDFVGSHSHYNRSNQGDFKIDWKASAKDYVSGRFTMYDSETQDILPVAIEFPSSPTTNPYKSFIVNEVHQFSPTAVNEFRAGFGRSIQGGGVPTDPSGQFGLSGNSKVGIPLPQSYPGFIGQTFNGTLIDSFGGASGSGSVTAPELYTENDFLYGDLFSLERGHHLMKIGAQFLRYQQNYSYAGNGGVLGNMTYGNNGFTFTGNSFADFVAGDLYTQDVPSVIGRFGQRQWRDGVFFQDDWKLYPNLTLNLGVRWDYSQPIYESNNKMANINLQTGAYSVAGQNGASRALYNSTFTQFLPRIGFAYSATPKFVLRGGYGITSYFEGMGANLRLTQNPPYDNETISQTTDIGAPLSVTAGLPKLPDGSNQGGTTYQAWDTNNRPSLTQQFSLTTEYQLSNASSIQIGYVGSTTQHMAIPLMANQLQSPVAPLNSEGQGPNQNLTIFQNLPYQPTGYLYHLTVKETRTGAMANYNALQITYHTRGSHGLDFTANYTLSHSLSNGGQGYDGLYGTNGDYYQQNSYNLSGEYGSTALDARHSLSGTLVYALPFGRGQQFGHDINRFEDLAIGGWKVSGLATVFTGNPLTLNSPGNYTSQLYAANAYPFHLRKMVIKNRSISGNWFGSDPSRYPCQADASGKVVDNGQCAYAAQSSVVGSPFNTFGSARPGSEIGPGFKNIDLSAFKAFNITQSQKIEFRADAFNAFNFANYAAPDTGIADTNFGNISQTRFASNGQSTTANAGQRMIQLSLNYHF